MRSGFSFHVALGHLPDALSRIIECRLPAAPICDRMSTFGYNRWEKLCTKANIKAVFGVELAVVPALGDKKPIVDYWKFFAKNDLKAINSLIALATSNPGKEPSLLYSQAIAAEGVIKIAGERALLEHIPTDNDDIYIALSPATSKGLYNAAKEKGHRFIACSDNYYPRQEDKELYRLSLGRRSNTQTYPMWILTDDEWRRSVEWVVGGEGQEQALRLRDHSLGKCTAGLTKAELLVPEKPKSLRELCEEGAIKLGIDLSNQSYMLRLDEELSLFAEKGFEDYMFVIADIMQFARANMVCGPGRGSSSGSLACYLLGITTVDPIPYGLLFERFVARDRNDPPDIDIDLSDTRRQLVFDYVEKKYGKERVARLGTVGMFQPKSAMNQVLKSLQLPSWTAERAMESLIVRNDGDARVDCTLYDTLTETPAGRKLVEQHPEVMYAAKLEGHPNNAGQHAAGIVITQKPVSDYVAVDMRTKSTMCDKKDAEDLGLLKIDALGLTQLSIFEQCLRLMGESDVSGWLEKLPLDDQKAFDVLNEGRWAGIFQFNGKALQGLAKQFRTETIHDMIAVTALARPGVTASGTWIKRRLGKELVTYPHPIFEQFLKDTYGVLVYQEQVMNIARYVGNMTWGEVTELRKAVSKTLGKVAMSKHEVRWKAGALENGVPQDVADKVWDDLCAHGAYSFNLAHAVAYGIVSYWCCWLKAHHPLEFAAATLEAESDPDKQIKLLRELATEGVGYVALDPELSTDHWVPAERDGRKILIGPLTNIKGIGPAYVNEILSCRRRGDPLRPALAKRLASSVTALDSLFPVADAVKRMHPDLEAISIVTKPTRIVDVQCGIDGEVVVIGVMKKIAPKNENGADAVTKRGRKVDGPVTALNMFIADDSDEIFAKIDRYDYERLGREVADRGGVGKALYALKGDVPRGFRMVSVKQIKFLGMME